VEFAAQDREIDRQDTRLAEALAEHQSRLRSFLRKQVADQSDVEDILQDAFCELMVAYRLMKPIGHVGGWLFRVARNRVIDSFRKKRPQSLTEATGPDPDRLSLEDLLPSADDGPEAAYWRGELLSELEAALDELPDEQREVFLAHEVEGRSFKDLAVETGLKVTTLLSRKRYAVLHLRQRLQHLYDDYTNRREK
jgi:RNA polymerase sigma factor (sigma-70 family)